MQPRDAIATIPAVLPPALRHELEAATLLVPPGEPMAVDDQKMAGIRRAIRTERKVDIHYREVKDRASTRTI